MYLCILISCIYNYIHFVFLFFTSLPENCCHQLAFRSKQHLHYRKNCFWRKHCTCSITSCQQFKKLQQKQKQKQLTITVIKRHWTSTQKDENPFLSYCLMKCIFLFNNDNHYYTTVYARTLNIHILIATEQLSHSWWKGFFQYWRCWFSGPLKRPTFLSKK